MARKEFSCDGERWEVVTDGTGVGAGASAGGHHPRISRWGVDFRRLSDNKEIHGTIGAADPNSVDDAQLCRDLKRAFGRKGS